MRFGPLCSLIVFLFLSSSAFADISAIHVTALPQESAILAAMEDAQQLEPYCNAWSPEWHYPIAKEAVASRLEKDLTSLNLALKNHPDNIDLLLLTGLVAHYAYNLDIPKTHEQAIAALDRARKLSLADVRGPWFHASLLCQTIETVAGADEFLAIEEGHPWNQLPSAFWDDYLTCATTTNMPAHALPAASYITELHAPNSELRTSITDANRDRFEPFNPQKTYQPKEVWEGSNRAPDTDFTSTTCGVRLRVHGNWTIDELGLRSGSCIAYFSTGPYKAVTKDLRPSILLLVQRPQANESLETFLRRFLKDGAFEPFAPVRCPAAACLSMKARQAGMYKVDGDGLGRIVVFEKDEPEFPELLFETPQGSPQVRHWRQSARLSSRQDSAAHTRETLLPCSSGHCRVNREPRMQDFDFFLQNLTVE